MKKNRFLLLIALSLFVFLPFKVSAMEIFVESDFLNKKVTLEVESSDTIEAVKEKIDNQEGMLAEHQILIFDDKELEHGRTLADYNIQPYDTIILKLKEIKIILDANEGLFTDSEQYIINDYYNEDFVYPTREGYTFKGWYTEKIGGLLFEYYNEKNIISDDMTFYAHWDKEGVATIDFTTFVDANNLTDLENASIEFLYNKGLILGTTQGITNASGKLLLLLDEDDNLSLAEGLTSSDNIVYTLSEEEKQQFQDENIYLSNIPDVIEAIFATENVEETYKVIFDANGGSFNAETTYIINEWKNEFYDSLTVPTREGYTFKGWYTEKNGGIKFEMILNESGIDSDMTFYAQWEQVVEVPKTFDIVVSSILMGTISLIGLIGSIIYLKKRNKVRI